MNQIIIPEVKGCVTLNRSKYALYLWWKGSDGKRQTRTITTGLPERGNKRKAEHLLDAAIEDQTELLRQQVTDEKHSDMLFGDFMKYWLSIVQPTLQISTYGDYRKKIENQIAPYFDKRKITLRKLTTMHIQEYYSYKLKTVTASTIRRYHTNFLKSLKYAKRMKLIDENPAEDVELPKLKKTRIEFCTIEELQQVLNITGNTEIAMPVILAVFYGLRRSEAIALKWRSVDFERKTVTIEGKVSQIKGAQADKKSRLYFDSELKTESSYRILPLLPTVEAALLRKQEQIKESRRFFGDAYHTEYADYICVRDDGKIIKPDYVSQTFKRYIGPLHLEKHVTYHGLRHSCATMLLYLGYDIKQIQEWLGHGHYTTTANFYAHLDMKSKNRMAESIDNSLSLSG